MKINRIMAIAAAVVALAACTKEQGNCDVETFKEGQEVTLNVTADASATKVTSELNGTAVDFKWQTGDKILVTVDSKTAEFTLASGAGSANATFTGTMPADGSSFDVQYPVTDPDLSDQAYSSTEAIAHDMMKFAQTGCTTSSSTLSLTPQNAALRLNLWGTDQTISKIVVTNKSTSDVYTLNISPAVTLSTDSANPTPFFVVVPTGSYNFSAEVISSDTGSSLATPPTDAVQNGIFTVDGPTFSTSSAKTFTAGEILNMDAKQVSYTKVYFSKGNLYYDQTDSPAAFKFEDTQYAYTTGDTYDASHVCRFCWAKKTKSLSNKLTGDIKYAISTSASLSGTTGDVFFTNATQTTPRADFTVAGQTGVWRTLSGGISSEWRYLLNNRSGVTIGSTTGCRYAEVKVNSICGLLIFPDTFTWPSGVSTIPSTFNTFESSWNSVDYTVDEFTKLENAGCVFLPAAGYRDGSSLYDVGSSCCYWSSAPASFNEYLAYCMIFSNISVDVVQDESRYYGCSVRLVSAAE